MRSRAKPAWKRAITPPGTTRGNNGGVTHEAIEMTVAEATSPAPNAVDTSGATTPAKAGDNSATEKAEAHETVLGPIEDELFGKRIRKSFGSRAFWGTIVTSYVVGGGVFYKVSFDDGDVDIVSAGEVLRDVAAGKRYADEDPCAEPSGSAVEGSAEVTAASPAISPYVDALRTKRAMLKRRRGSSESDHTEDSSPSVGASWEVKLWSVRLFATIMEEQGYIRLHEFVPMANGEPGEMEATGKIKPGDALIAVQGRLVHGRMDHTRACDLIRAAPRPVTLTFVRPPRENDSAGAAAVNAVIEANQESSAVPTSEPTADEALRKKARVDQQTSRPTSRESPSKASPLPVLTPAPPTAATVSRTLQARSRPPTPEAQAPREEPTGPADTVSHVQGPVSAVNQPSRGLSRTPSPPASISTVSAPSESAVASEAQVPSSSNRQHQLSLSRTPSPAPPVHGAAEERSSHPTTRAIAYQPPGQNMAPTPGSSLLQTVFIPAHLAPTGKAPLPSSSGRVSRYFAPRPVSGSMAPSGQPMYHHQQVPMNDGRNGGVLVTSSGMRATSNMIGAPRNGLHRHDPSTGTYFAPPAGSSILSLDQRPSPHTNGTQDPRYTYSRQMYGPASSSTQSLGHPPNAPFQLPSSATPFQHLPVQQRDQLLRGDERAQSMTLGDYMVYTAQQERLALRLASQQRNLGGALSAPQHRQLHAPSLAAQEPLTNPPPTTETNHEHRESSPPPVSDEGSSFLDLSSGIGGAVSDTPASTGSSFLSLDQISLLEEIPVNGKTKASRMRTAFRQATETSHDPSFLRKYESDGVVKVVITQPRLYLTLAPLGQYVSISSFVRGDLGEVGEIEASGKVLPGDVLIGVGSLEIPPFMSPGDVARIVNSQPRPYSAYFIRATWEMLE